MLRIERLQRILRKRWNANQKYYSYGPRRYFNQNSKWNYDERPCLQVPECNIMEFRNLAKFENGTIGGIVWNSSTNAIINSDTNFIQNNSCRDLTQS